MIVKNYVALLCLMIGSAPLSAQPDLNSAPQDLDSDQSQTPTQIEEIADAQALPESSMSSSREALDQNSLKQACQNLPVDDACEIIAETARFLSASYMKKGGAERLIKEGYFAEYFGAKTRVLGNRTKMLFVRKPGSNRIYVMFTGTESLRDWYENAKVKRYRTIPKDGRYYIPSGHAGFRRAVLNLIGKKVLVEKEFDELSIDCTAKNRKQSRFTRFVCRSDQYSELGNSPICNNESKGLPAERAKYEIVVAGHSRGAGISVMAAPAFHGLHFREEEKSNLTVKRQKCWPFAVRAVVGYAPPYSVYKNLANESPDDPTTNRDNHQILNDHGLAQRTVMFVNEHDVLPVAFVREGSHFGHQFRIFKTQDENGEFGKTAVTYMGNKWSESPGFGPAHSNVGYCNDILSALSEETQVCLSEEE